MYDESVKDIFLFRPPVRRIYAPSGTGGRSILIAFFYWGTQRAFGTREPPACRITGRYFTGRNINTGNLRRSIVPRFPR